ncbi:MAG: hypothetical protein K2K26_02940, partial [Muribaculaceae bacterium]|nr:hypothetical protein [Muribaculaceae bacterium]
YDMTFIFNTNGTGPNIERRLSIGGKTSEITKADLLNFAKQNDIKNAKAIINRIADAIKDFNRYATEYGITQSWRSITQKTLTENLKAFGFLNLNKEDHTNSSFSDTFGRTINNLSLSVNSKGHIEVLALINGKRHRKFIRPNMEIYSDLMKQDIFNLPLHDKIRLVETLFPLE